MMTREEALLLMPGDSVYVLDQENDDWPDSYDEYLGKTVTVCRVEANSGRYADVIIYDPNDGSEIALRSHEVSMIVSDLGEISDDTPDIKLLFGGGG